MNTNKKVVLVGTGFVGMSMAYAMMNQGGVDELVLIDVLKDKAKGEEMDLSHGLPYAPQKMDIKAGDYSECKDANVVVITAGLPQKPGQSRLELAVSNTKIVKEITEQVMANGFNGVFIIASNPVDLMSYVVAQVSGLPKSRVIGSGTVLDTARLRYLIAEYLDVSSKNVHAYILGEHGDSSLVPWEYCYVGCKSIIDIMKDNNHPMEDLKKIHDEVWKAAYEIIEKKRATYYGIGMALNRIIKAVLNDENSILTVSTYQNGEYNQEGMYIGVPAIINKNGVKEILELKLNAEDQAKFNHSCDIMKENIENENAQKYIEILENKSKKLKNLTEDLIEASKISSGNETVNLQKLNFAEMILQANGEFAEKYESKDLKLISKIEKEGIFAQLDSKKMWRVLENIYNNAYKHSLEGTRIYVNVEQNDKIVFTMKNISKEELNITPEELMERFVRGDKSRTSGGNGLRSFNS